VTGLGSVAETAIKNASASGSGRAARSLRRYLSDGRWLQKENRYRVGASLSIKADDTASKTKAPHISAYVAASAPLHCADGWALLGKALASHSVGDSATCTHLAYYAELRAAMSLLAVGGVGVFDRIHFTLSAKGAAKRVAGTFGTHRLAWEALRLWSETPEAAKVVSAAIRPYGIGLAEWLSGYPPMATWAPIASGWLQAWGIDIERYIDDQQLRNEASYRPSGLRYQRAMPVDEALGFLTDFWRSLEPGDSEFAPLDKALLREAIRNARAATSKGTSLVTVVDAILANAGISGGAAGGWRTFLTSKETNPLIVRASTVSPNSTEASHLEVVCRAALLLRVATGASSNYLTRAGIGADALNFWWAGLAEDCGLWSGAEPANLVDLWADILEAIQDIQLASPIGSYATSADLAFQRAVLSQSERPLLWGLIGPLA